jgi:malate-CoA ligase subunit alpha
MKAVGIGISTSVGIGGDPINGSAFRDHLERFEQDPETRLVVMIGEIGGPQEAEAAAYARDHMTKPVLAYIAGLTAPRGRTMGHAGAIVTSAGESAGAIVTSAGESAAEKVEILREAGVGIIVRPSEFGNAVAQALARL